MNKTILINDAQIDVEIIDEVLAAASLPSGKILLILSDGYLQEGYLGCCLPKSLIAYQDLIGIFNSYLDRGWDCGVALSAKACRFRSTHPAYFTYLLGHELGHAYVCINDISVHIHSCLIQDFICKASFKKVSQWHELPHEELFDQFGIYVAESLFSRQQLDSEITSLLGSPDCQDKDRLELMLSLPPFKDFKGLRDKLVQFAAPYKTELIKLWKAAASESNSASLLDLIDDYELLFV